MFGINKSCERLWEARSAIWSETKNTFNRGTYDPSRKVKPENKEALATLHKKDIVMMGIVAAILALGVTALSWYGLYSIPDNMEHLAPILLLAVTAGTAFTVACTIPIVSKHLLNQVDETHLEFQNLPNL